MRRRKTTPALGKTSPSSPMWSSSAAAERRAGAAKPLEDRALIAAVLDNPHAPPQTVAFVADLRRWLDLRGPLTLAQRDALHRTHRRWGLGAA